MNNNCDQKWGRTSTNPSTGGQVKINPSAVPIEAGLGIEGLFYKNSIDLSLVRGTGRVGAAISPSNSEETFFGPPAFENFDDYYNRKLNLEKLPNQKYTFAAAMNILKKNGSGLGAYAVKLGLMAKYNKLTTAVSPGAGLNGVIGPITFGGSYYKDQTQLNDPITGDEPKTRINYNVQTYNVGVFLTSLILDYSKLELSIPDVEGKSEVTLLTASLFIDKVIFTAAKRTETSDRLAYNFDTHLLEYQPVKDDYFGGAQYSVNKHLMVGAFYNYYLLHEASLSLTVFF